MKRVQAKIVEISKEDPASEPDQDPNTWLVEAELRVGIRGWETARLDFQSSEIDTEIIESSMTGPTYFTVRIRGKSALKKGDVLHVNIR
jgi:hypothetical protein